MSQVQRALGNEPGALEAAAEAAAICAELAARRPDKYTASHTSMLLQHSDLLARTGRHGEALAARGRHTAKVSMPSLRMPRPRYRTHIWSTSGP